MAVFYSMVCKPKQSKIIQEDEECQHSNVLDRLGFVQLQEDEVLVGKNQTG